MDILAVSAELFPLVKTGGLADVAASLPKALSGRREYGFGNRRSVKLAAGSIGARIGRAR